MIEKSTYKSFFNAIYSVILNKEKSNKTSVEKLASNFGITDKNTIKEITETAIVTIARKIANQQNKSVKQKYDEIVDLYKSQVNLSHRTSQSMLLQQYSTPATIGYLMGVYCRIDVHGYYYEPSAGNGMLTIANTGKDFTVNEIDATRSQNLEFQDVFELITKTDSSKETYRSKYFDAIITNPPFSTLNKDEYLTLGEYEIKHLDHKMAILALNSMKDNGKAAIIVGGHTSWDDKGRIQAGKNRIFLSYLYKNYNVDDIILIDGNALYSKMGTGFDTRIILINGRKPKSEGFAPLKNNVLAQVVTTTDDLYNRFSMNFENKKYNIDEIIDEILEDDWIKGSIEREDAELKKAGWTRKDIQGFADFVTKESKIYEWDVTFTSGKLKNVKLSKLKFESLEFYSDNIVSVNFDSENSSQLILSEVIGLLSITNNPVKIGVILDGNDIWKDQKVKRRLQSVAEKSNRLIAVSNLGFRENRYFPFTFITKKDIEKYTLASEFKVKLLTPKKALFTSINNKYGKGKALRLRAKAISIKQKQLLELGQLGVSGDKKRKIQ